MILNTEINPLHLDFVLKKTLGIYLESEILYKKELPILNDLIKKIESWAFESNMLSFEIIEIENSSKSINSISINLDLFSSFLDLGLMLMLAGFENEEFEALQLKVYKRRTYFCSLLKLEISEIENKSRFNIIMTNKD